MAIFLAAFSVSLPFGIFNAEERLPNVTEFFNKEFGFASKEINYNNEFLKSLDAISESPVFVTVKNSENLIKDLNNNPEFSKRFYN